jgi:dihydroorotate dehydrogenase (fumarate)
LTASERQRLYGVSKMDLTTTYLGLPLKNPLVASASPLTLSLDNIRRLEDAGAAAVVMPSIFEEQIRYEVSESEQRVSVGMDTNPEAQSYFPFTAYHTGPRTYLDHVQQARCAVDIPVIASLNGISETVGPTMHGCSRRPAPARWNSILSSSRAT